eukprot:776409_1
MDDDAKLKMEHQDPGPPPDGNREKSDDGQLAKLKDLPAAVSRSLPKALSELSINADAKMQNNDPESPPEPPYWYRENAGNDPISKLKALRASMSRRLSKALSGLSINADARNDDVELNIPEDVADGPPGVQDLQDQPDVPEVQDVPEAQDAVPQVQGAQPAAAQRNRRRIGSCGRKSLYALLAFLVGCALFSGLYFGVIKNSSTVDVEHAVA